MASLADGRSSMGSTFDLLSCQEGEEKMSALAIGILVVAAVMLMIWEIMREKK